MKKLISFVLAVMIALSCTVVSSALYSWDSPEAITVDEAIQNYINEGNEAPETYRYYFLMPNGHNGEKGDDRTADYYGEYAPTWYMELYDGVPATNTAGIYWWDSGVTDPTGWIGYLPSGTDANDPDVYYADVPVAVYSIIWNNGVDGGMEPEDPIYYCAAQSTNIGAEYYDSGESPNYPDGTDNFDNMIFVVDPDLISINELSNKQTCGGEWYYYYGNGCYGFTKDGDVHDCLRDDHYDANSNHVGNTNTPTPKPTTKPTQAPTEPEGDVLYDGAEFNVYVPSYDFVTLAFTPKTSDYFTFESHMSTSSSYDPYGYLYGSNSTLITSNDDDGDGYNFSIRYYLEAGKTYYFKIKNRSSSYSLNCPISLHSDNGPIAEPTEPPVLETQYMISEFTKEDADKVNGVICGYMGDIDDDGEISVLDATEIQLIVAQLKTVDDIHTKLADTDNDGDISVLDATEIQLYAAQLITSDVIGHILYSPRLTFDPERFTYIKSDGEYYMVTDDYSFTYTTYLACDAKISSLDATVFYDSEGIEFIPDTDEWDDYTGNEFPNINSIIYNYGVDGQIIFNFANYRGIEFPISDNNIKNEENIVFTGEFEVTRKPGVYEIDNALKILGGAPNVKIIYNYEHVNDDVTVITDSKIDGLLHLDSSLIAPQPTEEPATQAPTKAPTERPTEEPTNYPTQAPTEAWWPTEAPTDAWWPSEAPTAPKQALHDGARFSISLEAGEEETLPFTPRTSGYYEIRSDIGLKSTADPVCSLYDENGFELAFNDDTNGFDFKIQYLLTRGETYYYKIKNYQPYVMTCPIEFDFVEAVSDGPATPDQPSHGNPTFPDYPGYPHVLNFDPSNTGWYNYKYISCHIWIYGGDSFYAWASKGERCTDSDGDGIWTYDLDAKGVTLESGTLYAVIFYADTGMQTHNLLLSAACMGDTAYCRDPYFKYENPEDSSKSCIAAFWSGQDASVFGPEMAVTSIGNVVGTCIPYTTSAQSMFEDFLEEKLENARTYSGKDDQTLLDDTAEALGLTKADVKTAIANTGVTVNWNASKSPLNSGAEVDDPIINPSAPSQAEAFDEIKNYLMKNTDNFSLSYNDSDISYYVDIQYNLELDAIEIYGYDYATSRHIDTYMRISRNDSTLYYESEMYEYIDNDMIESLFKATGYGHAVKQNPLSFSINKGTFTSPKYTFAQAEKTITTGFEKALTVADFALTGKVKCSAYNLV